MKRYLPSGMLIAQIAPLDQYLPARARQAGATAHKGAGAGPGLLHQHARLAAVPPLEVDHLPLGNAHQQRLRHPFVVDVGLAYPLHQVLCVLFRTWNDRKTLKEQDVADTCSPADTEGGSAEGLPGRECVVLADRCRYAAD